MMSTGTILIVIVAAVAVLLVIWGIVTHNSLIARRNRVRQCRSGICVVLKQRNDLIPNLVASVKAYMGHENELLTRITDLRSRAPRPRRASRFAKAASSRRCSAGSMSQSRITPN